ncbi:MAG: hypothetical protein V4495_25305 [Pseudomonadota bacterium]
MPTAQDQKISQQAEGLYANITLTDLQLASAYYPILIDLAKHKHCLTYGELVERAKQAYPSKNVVQQAIAVSTGRRLDVVRLFTSERGLPDITSLIISKGSGECGIGFTQYFDPKLSREEVFTFDWSEVTIKFDGFLQETESAIRPRKKLKQQEALEVMAEYYKNNKDALPKSVRNYRELIIESIMEGISVVDAFAQVPSDVK